MRPHESSAVYASINLYIITKVYVGYKVGDSLEPVIPDQQDSWVDNKHLL